MDRHHGPLHTLREQNSGNAFRRRLKTGTSQEGDSQASKSIDFSRYSNANKDYYTTSHQQNMKKNPSKRKVSFPSSRLTLPANKLDNNQIKNSPETVSQKLKLFTTGQLGSRNVFKHYPQQNSLSNVKSMNVTIANSTK